MAAGASSAFADFSFTLFGDNVTIHNDSTVSHDGAVDPGVFYTFQAQNKPASTAPVNQDTPTTTWIDNKEPYRNWPGSYGVIASASGKIQEAGGNNFDVIGLYGIADSLELRFGGIFSLNPEGNTLFLGSPGAKIGPGDLRIVLGANEYGLGLRPKQFNGYIGGSHNTAPNSTRPLTIANVAGLGTGSITGNPLVHGGALSWYRYNGVAQSLDGKDEFVFDPTTGTQISDGNDGLTALTWTHQGTLDLAGVKEDREVWVVEGSWQWGAQYDGSAVSLYTAPDCTNDIIKIHTTPEPSTIVLLSSSGLSMVLGYGLRRRRKLVA
jgi:hypothetical protein